MKIVSVEHVRRIEAEADASGFSYDTMMDNAGRAAATAAARMLEGVVDARVTLLIGKGNNGGDGLVCARYLAELKENAQIRLYLLTHRPDADPLMAPLFENGVFITYAEDDHDKRLLRNMISTTDLLVDALFGIGIRLPIKGEAEAILRQTNRVIRQRQAETPDYFIDHAARPYNNKVMPPLKIIALDCPSGLDCDSGEIDANAIAADETITFIAAKTGLVQYPGAGAVGNLQIASIGIPQDLESIRETTPQIATKAMTRGLLPLRADNSHKGSHGKVMVIAGSSNYVGAVGLAATAAYRAGAGLVTVATPERIIDRLAGKLLEPTWIPLQDSLDMITDDLKVMLLDPGYTTMLIGPGMGQSPHAEGLLSDLLTHELPPLVIDADGLNLLAKMDDWPSHLPDQTILTPHPGEMARLSGVNIADIQSNRLQLAHDMASAWGVVLVLKGAHAVIAAPDDRLVVLPFKNDGLATAGTGDVLAGVIGGLRGQGIDAFDAAVIGSYAHGLAGEIWVEKNNRRALIAGDLLNALPDAWRVISG